jgi:hypothetical protein
VTGFGASGSIASFSRFADGASGLSDSEPSVPLECLHEHAIRVGEVVELPRKCVLPPHSVKKIIPIAKNDNEERGQAISRIVVRSVYHGSHEIRAIVRAQMEILKMIREVVAISEIAMTKVSQLPIIRPQPEAAQHRTKI